MKYIKIFFIPALLLGFLFYCGEEGTPPDEKEYIIPESDISYYKDLLPMFEGKCGYGSGCHNETYAGSGDNFLFFGTKEALMEHVIPESNDTKLLDPLLVLAGYYEKDPGIAPLYLILTQRTYFGYERQPPATFGRAPLTENQLNGILTWIKEGAGD